MFSYVSLSCYTFSRINCMDKKKWENVNKLLYSERVISWRYSKARANRNLRQKSTYCVSGGEGKKKKHWLIKSVSMSSVLMISCYFLLCIPFASFRWNRINKFLLMLRRMECYYVVKKNKHSPACMYVCGLFSAIKHFISLCKSGCDFIKCLTWILTSKKLIITKLTLFFFVQQKLTSYCNAHKIIIYTWSTMPKMERKKLNFYC